MNIQIKGLFLVLFFVFVVGESGILAGDGSVFTEDYMITKNNMKDVISRTLLFLYSSDISDAKRLVKELVSDVNSFFTELKKNNAFQKTLEDHSVKKIFMEFEKNNLESNKKNNEFVIRSFFKLMEILHDKVEEQYFSYSHNSVTIIEGCWSKVMDLCSLSDSNHLCEFLYEKAECIGSLPCVFDKISGKVRFTTKEELDVYSFHKKKLKLIF